MFFVTAGMPPGEHASSSPTEAVSVATIPTHNRKKGVLLEAG
jgi:hypothetical protein